jgi:hypothetical protein
VTLEILEGNPWSSETGFLQQQNTCPSDVESAAAGASAFFALIPNDSF